MSKNNRKLCQSCLPRYQGDILQRIFSEKVLFFHHWAFSDFCLSFLRKFVGPVVSTVFCLSNGPVCGEKTFVQKFFYHHFWTLIAKWSVFVRIFFGQVDDTAFYGSKGSIWGLKAVLTNFCLFYLSFADLEPKNHGFFPENNRQGCQNCSPRVQGDILQGNFFRKVFFCLIIGHWSTFVCHFDEKLSLPLSVLFSVCQLDQFLVNKCLSKLFSTTFTDIQQKFVCFFSETLSVNLTKLHSTSPEEKFEDKTLFWQRCCLFFECSSKIERRNNGFFCQKNNRQICHIWLPRVQEDFVKFF